MDNATQNSRYSSSNQLVSFFLLCYFFDFVVALFSSLIWYINIHRAINTPRTKWYWWLCIFFLFILFYSLHLYWNLVQKRSSSFVKGLPIGHSQCFNSNRKKNNRTTERITKVQNTTHAERKKHNEQNKSENSQK